MRLTAIAFAAVWMAIASPSEASFTLDLIWEETGTPTLTIQEGDPATPAAACDGGVLYAGSSANHCLRWRLTSATNARWASSSIGWNAGDSGIATDFVPAKSHGSFGAQILNGMPLDMIATTHCAPACDTAYGSLGTFVLGGGGSPLTPGSYFLGSISFDLTGAVAGTHEISNFTNPGSGLFPHPGYDKYLDGNELPVPAQLNPATLIVLGNPKVPSLGAPGRGVLALAVFGCTALLLRRMRGAR